MYIYTYTYIYTYIYIYTLYIYLYTHPVVGESHSFSGGMRLPFLVLDPMRGMLYPSTAHRLKEICTVQ